MRPVCWFPLLLALLLLSGLGTLLVAGLRELRR